jgi:hypothetical protein
MWQDECPASSRHNGVCFNKDLQARAGPMRHEETSESDTLSEVDATAQAAPEPQAESWQR